MDVSQSHTSVPSRSIARILYEPPGNTTTAAPEFRATGLYKVSVGTETLPMRITGLPATVRSFTVVVSISGPVVVLARPPPVATEVTSHDRHLAATTMSARTHECIAS